MELGSASFAPVVAGALSDGARGIGRRSLGCDLVRSGRSGRPGAAGWVAHQDQLVFVDSVMAVATEKGAVFDVGGAAGRRFPRDDVVGVARRVVGSALNAAVVTGDQCHQLFISEVPLRSSLPQHLTGTVDDLTNQLGPAKHLREEGGSQQAACHLSDRRRVTSGHLVGAHRHHDRRARTLPRWARPGAGRSTTSDGVASSKTIVACEEFDGRIKVAMIPGAGVFAS